MSYNNFKQQVNKYLRKFGRTNLDFLSKFELLEFEEDYLLKVKPEKTALRLLIKEGTTF